MTTGVGRGFAPSAAAANAALGGTVRQDAHPAGVEGTRYSLSEMGRLIKEGRNDPRVRAWAGTTISRAEAAGLAKRVDSSAWVESDKVAQGFTARARTKAKVLAEASAGALHSAWQELCARLRGMLGVSPNDGRITKPRAQAQALLDEVRRVTHYVQDPVGTELMAKPHVTVCLDDFGLCLPANDCDDRCILLISALMSIGIDARAVGEAYGTDQATHVIGAFRDEDAGEWVKVDPSHERWPVGETHPSTKSWWLDPLSGSISEDAADGMKSTLGKEPENGDFIGVGAVPERAPEGTGIFPFAHAFSPLAHGASYVPVGLESGLPCEPDGTECGEDGSVVAEFVCPPPATQAQTEPAAMTAYNPVKVTVPPAEPVTPAPVGGINPQPLPPLKQPLSIELFADDSRRYSSDD
jgi:hypothetical protein